jgi:hypothetical protein
MQRRFLGQVVDARRSTRAAKMPTVLDMLPRALVAVAVVSSLALAAPAAEGKMFVSSSVGVDGSGHVEGYAIDTGTYAPLNDNLTLDVQRAGASVGTASGQAYAGLPGLALRAGDVVTLTDADTSEVHSFAYTGGLSLALDGLCGGKFAGARDEGASVSISAASSDGGAVSGAVVASGPGTTFAGGFTTPLTSAWTIKASQTVADPAFTVFSDVSAAVSDCPQPAPAPVVTAAPVPAPTPAPVPVPAAPAATRDLIAPNGTLKLRTLNAYRALLGGTFTDAVTTTEAGTVAQTLYAGKVVVATGRAKVARAGSATVRVTLTRSGRSHVRSHKATALRLVTTLTDTSGNTRVLTPKHFTVKRGH